MRNGSIPGAYAPWLLTDVPLGLRRAEKSPRNSRAVLNLPLTMQKRGYVQFTHAERGIRPIHDQRRSASFFRMGVPPPPATYDCICLSRNAAEVNSQGCKPLEIALSMRHSRNAATVQFREVPYHPRSGLIVIPHDVHPLGFWNNSENRGGTELA